MEKHASSILSHCGCCLNRGTGLNHYGIPRKKAAGGTGGRGSVYHLVTDKKEKHQAGLADRTDWLPVDRKLSLRCNTESAWLRNQ